MIFSWPKFFALVFFIAAVAAAPRVCLGFDADPVDGVGLEVRQYPLGTIPSLQLRSQLSPSLEGLLSAGANIAYHGSQGEQDRESGLGWGAGVGVRHKAYGAVFAGARLDLWRMAIDWTNTHRANEPPSGTSRFLIVQPTLEIGTNILMRNRSVWLTPTLSFGGEINAFDHDAPTGHGLIILLGLAAGLSEKNY
jgi:hypothetical protein